MEAKQEYINWFRNRYISEEELEYLREIKDDDEKIEELFGTDLTFEGNKLEGTLGMGTAHLNRYQICRVVQSYCNHLKLLAGGRVQGRVGVGYDSRVRNEEWSESVCRMLLGNGIGTSLFLGPKSEEQLIFAIEYLKLEGGIMLTADDDDKNLYGIRFYDKNGAPMDENDMMGVMLGFQSIHNQSQMKPYVGAMRMNSIHRKIGISNDHNFIQSILSMSVSDDVDKDLKIAYSPLYGAGVEFVPQLMEEAGYDHFYTVKEEMKFDGEFPGLERPDPADERVFAKVLEKAREKDADVAIVTNPNLREFGAAVKTGEGEYKILSQEEQKALLEEYKAKGSKEKRGHAWLPGPTDLYLFIEMMAHNRKNG